MRLNIEKIKALMTVLEMTQTDLAKKMGVSRQWIHIVLNGDGAKSFRAVQKFAEVFNVDAKDLII